VLAAGAVATAAAVLPGLARAEEAALPRRALGSTGVTTTVFGLGTFPLGNLQDEEAASQVLIRALDLGVSYLDTAPSYARGRSETLVGRALAQRKDAVVFVATKTLARTAEDARRDLDESLARIGRPSLDLVQVHALKDAADLERVLAPKGVLAGLAKAREEGLVRFLGVTGHEDPSVMRAAVERGVFDVLLLPLNCVDPHHRSFQKETLPFAVERKIGRVAMKVFASGNLTAKGIDAEACLRYVYGLDVATAVVGCRTVAEVDAAVRVAREARALDAQATQVLLEQTAPHRGVQTEWYKRV
jgi:aryl-alcohol dehydrogenase-like predicted oxidoreductase